jgi:hypothetical protein
MHVEINMTDESPSITNIISSHDNNVDSHNDGDSAGTIEHQNTEVLGDYERIDTEKMPM